MSDPNGHGRLVDAPLERAFVAALLEQPTAMLTLPDEFGIDCLGDGQAILTFAAMANLRAQGKEITRASVRDEIVRNTGNPDSAAWFDPIARIVPSAEAPVLGWAASLVRMAARRRALIEDHDASERDVDDFALRDAEGPRTIDDEIAAEPAVPSSPLVLLRDAVPLIRARAALPWIEIGIDDIHALARGRAGSCVFVVGWEGSGKSSLVIQAGLHAASRGLWFVYVTTELDAEEAAARGIGIVARRSWEDVLRGRLDDAEMLASCPEAFAIVDSDRATLANAERAVAEMRRRFPDRQGVLALDYLQDLAMSDGDMRSRVALVSRGFRRLAKRLDVFAIAVSQTSRGTKKLLRDGELVGADTASSGAESSQIERDAYVTLTFGAPQRRDDGTLDVELHVGKGRMTEGDRVWPLRFDGRTGRFEVLGASRTGDEVREERERRKDALMEESRSEALERIETHVDALLAFANEPKSRNDIFDPAAGGVGGNRRSVLSVVDRMVRSGAIVRVKGKRFGQHWPLALRTRAVELGWEIVPDAVE